MAKTDESLNIESWILKEWTLRLKQSLESMTGEPAQVQTAAEAPPPGPETSWWRQPFSLGQGCEVWAGAPEASRDAIGGRVLSSAGIDDASSEDRTGTYHEILNQALAGLAHGLTGLAGKEVTAGAGSVLETAPEQPTAFHVSFGGGAPLPVYFGWARAIAGCLEPKKPATPVKPPAPPREGQPAADSAAPPGPARALDLLYDVELPVSVSFGRAHLPLKEVLKLTSGSIIELNRTVIEPVEVIVNNCVIARGEVVVVEGNYGVRIQQIVSRNERLRTLQ